MPRVRDRARSKPKLKPVKWPNGSQYRCAKTGRVKGYIVRRDDRRFDVHTPSGRKISEAGTHLLARGLLR